jgi:hypothetical protein
LGISIEDTLSHNDFGSPNLEKKGWRRQNRKKEQLQNKAKKPWGRMVEEDTENTDHVRPGQQPFMEVDAPVKKGKTKRVRPQQQIPQKL